MSSLFEQYCDVTESVAFKSTEINSSESIDSAKSNKTKLNKLNKLKCFNCFGIQAKEDFCNECGNMGYVTETHPLAMLFNNVLCHKLGAVPQSN